MNIADFFYSILVTAVFIIVLLIAIAMIYLIVRSIIDKDYKFIPFPLIILFIALFVAFGIWIQLTH